MPVVYAGRGERGCGRSSPKLDRSSAPGLRYGARGCGLWTRHGPCFTLFCCWSGIGRHRLKASQRGHYPRKEARRLPPNSFDYLELEKTKLEVAVFGVELRDRALCTETTLGGDAKESHTRREATRRATAVDWGPLRTLGFTALCIMPTRLLSWICSPNRNGLLVKVFKGARHRSKNPCAY